MDLRRVAVVGTSCAGKTTLAAALAARLQVRHIELDALHWGPEWTPVPHGAFRQAVAAATAADRWVCDGNYGMVRDLVWRRATTVVWLDYGFPTVLLRGVYRTVRRALLREQLYSGNRESLTRAFFRRDSILLWVMTSHWRHRRRYPALFGQEAFAHLQVVRFKSPRMARDFLRQVVAEPVRVRSEERSPPRCGCRAHRE